MPNETQCPHADCERSCSFWTQKVGNAVDTVIEPIHLEWAGRIEEAKKTRKRRN